MVVSTAGKDWRRCLECRRLFVKEPTSGRRGLCQPCYGRPAVRAKYPKMKSGYLSEAYQRRRGIKTMRSVSDIFRSHAVFDDAGRHVNGTDKQSNHNYGDAYEQIIKDNFGLLSKVNLMMEVGVADGACLRAWREVFPVATIVGMDIHPCAAAGEDRIEFHLGDMGKQKDCRRAVDGRQFDLIVEDGTHYLVDTLRCLLFLWPSVRPGGLYVVEEFPDVHELRENIKLLFNAEVVDTQGPFGGVEPLVVLKKSWRDLR